MAILFADYLVVTLIGSIVLFWLAEAAALLFLDGSFGYLIAATGLTVAAVPVTLLRIIRIKRLITKGEAVQGEVRRAYYQTIRGRVEFSYSTNGKDYLGIQPFLNRPDTPRLNPGTTIRVLVDPRAPRRAALAALFETG